MDDLRADLNNALDSAADDNDYDETQQEVMTDGVEPENTLDTSGANTEGEHTESTDEGAAAESPNGGAAKPASADAGAENSGTENVPAADAKPEPHGDSIKAPIDWGPKEREDWSKIPRHLQEKVMAREKELGNMMQTTKDARQTHSEFGQLVQQYGSVLSGVMGNTPMETTRNLFDTVANLRMGSPIQKAQIIADMISNFGVDINTLDSAIVGAAPPPEQAQNQQFEAELNRRMAPFEEMMGQQKSYQQQQANQRQESANNEVADFGKNAEFLGDVRNDMADLIEMAGARGQNMSMQQAYDKACAINPQISAVMQERQQHATLTGNNDSMAAKRNAASSVNGRQSGGGGGSGALSMRDQIAEAWDGQDSI